MWQMMVAQAVGSGVNAYMTERANKKLGALQKQMYDRNVKTLRDNEKLQLQAIGENFTYKMQMMARQYTEAMASVNREVRDKRSSINVGSVQRGIDTPDSSFAQDMKTKLNEDYSEAMVIHGAVQAENISNMAKMNVTERINLIKGVTQQVIDGRFALANSLGSIAQSTQNAYSQAGLASASSAISYGIDRYRGMGAKQKAGSLGQGTLNPDNSLSLSTPNWANGFDPNSRPQFNLGGIG